MKYEVGDRVVYTAHVSNSPGGISGSMSTEFRMEGTVKTIKPRIHQMLVAWELPAPVFVVTAPVNMNDPAVSKLS